jgi:hypothetical protein
VLGARLEPSVDAREARRTADPEHAIEIAGRDRRQLAVGQARDVAIVDASEERAEQDPSRGRTPVPLRRYPGACRDPEVVRLPRDHEPAALERMRHARTRPRQRHGEGRHVRHLAAEIGRVPIVTVDQPGRRVRRDGEHDRGRAEFPDGSPRCPAVVLA